MNEGLKDILLNILKSNETQSAAREDSATKLIDK